MELVTAPEEEEVVLDTAESGIDADETIIELEAKPMKIKSDVADGGERRLEILRQTLEWGHLAPTVPGEILIRFSLQPSVAYLFSDD